jgi:hypothetical protein
MKYPSIKKSERSMTQYETDRFQSLLKTKAAEATKTLHNRVGIIVERAADEFDEIAIAFERDIQFNIWTVNCVYCATF